MYSRNYGFTEDTPSKITPPPDYSGSAIQQGNIVNAPQGKESADKDIRADKSSLPNDKASGEKYSKEQVKETFAYKDECNDKPLCGCGKCPAECEKKEKPSGIFSGMCAEDMILMGLVAALAFGVADKDILLVALVIATVIM
ncbi:MAG: hypothetical protein ACI4QR_05930 [Eubacteriales bacterium]